MHTVWPLSSAQIPRLFQVFLTEVLTFMTPLEVNRYAYVNFWVNIVVLCEYSKFRIQSNSYFSIRFDSKRAQLFEIFEYLPSPNSYLFISSRLTDYRQKYRLPVALFNYQLSQLQQHTTGKPQFPWLYNDQCQINSAVRIVFLFHFKSNSWAITWNLELNRTIIVGLKSHQ